jgi:V8-like Glu-specific endopeptidase
MTKYRTAAFTSLLACGACAGEVAIEAPFEEVEQYSQYSICGSTVDWQNVETYDGTLGPTTAFVAARQRPVGMISIGCSGTLIARDLFLTAAHCVPSITVGTSVVHFNYQRAPDGTVRTTTPYTVNAVVEDGGSTLDYAILRLAGNLGDLWGTTTPAAFPQPNGQRITIIQHPNANPKVVEGGRLQVGANGLLTYDDLDTLGGSSGSGILQDSTGYVIGVHTFGVSDGTCGVGDPNSGPSMLQIRGLSQTIRTLAMDAAKVSLVAGG